MAVGHDRGRCHKPLTRRYAPPSPRKRGEGQRGRVALRPACGEKVAEGRMRGVSLEARKGPPPNDAGGIADSSHINRGALCDASGIGIVTAFISGGRLGDAPATVCHASGEKAFVGATVTCKRKGAASAGRVTSAARIMDIH